MSRMKRYKVEKGKTILELNIANFEQFFDKRDPNPYRSKDLDEDIVEYLVASVQEVGVRNLGGIEIITPSELSSAEKEDLSFSIKDFFLYREEICQKQVKATLILGLKTLLIGLSFLSVALVMPAILQKFMDGWFVEKFLSEGLLLVGWVSMWKPVNIFLYDWWPLSDMAKVHWTLSQQPIRYSVTKAT